MRFVRHASATAICLLLVAAGCAPQEPEEPPSDPDDLAGDVHDFEVDARSWTCERLMLVTNFPYSDVEWLAQDEAAEPRQGVESVEFLGATLPFARVRPERVTVSSARNVSSLWVRAGEFEQGVAVRAVGSERQEEADSLAQLLSAESIESDGLREFGRLDFDDQLAWYLDNGQGAYECTRSSALRDLKKLIVEETLGVLPGLQPGSASFGRFGLIFATDEGPRTFGISQSGWLRLGGWSPSDAEFDEVAADFDSHEILSMFEALVLGQVSEDEFREFLDRAAIEYELNLH